MIKDEVGSYVVRDKNQPERRRHPRKRAFWLGRLETPDGRFDCRVLNLSPGGAKVMLAHVVPEKQAVTLIVEPLGEFVGVVGWQRDSYIGIQVVEHRAIRHAAATSAPKPAEPEPSDRATPDTSSPDHLPLADADAKPQPAAAAPGISVERRPTENPLDLLHDARTIRALQPGEILFKEGDSAQSLYIVKSGALRIKSGNVVYEDVQTGGIVGEMGLVEQHMPRSATVYALTAAEVVEIDERRFFSLVERIPSFAIAVMRVLSRRLRHMDDLYRPERWTGLHR